MTKNSAHGLAPDTRQPEIDTLIDACWADVDGAFGITGPRQGPAHRVLRGLCAGRIERLADQLAHYDGLVASHGLPHAAGYALRCLRRPVAGHGRVPAEGPLLLVSNHPGLADSVALFAQLPRTDLRVIAAHRALLHALPATARHLFFISEAPASCRSCGKPWPIFVAAARC